MKWCEIFKAGTHIDHSGKKVTVTTADIDKIISNFNEKNPDVPLVIGHPKVNSPAYGWVDKLKREGKTLLATFKDVSSEFAEWVNQGLYKTRSISLYEDNTLRHIGWLGAQPPAIKGLASYQFAENEEVQIFDFSEADFRKSGESLSSAISREGERNSQHPEPRNEHETPTGDFSEWQGQDSRIIQRDNYKFQTIADILSDLRDFLIEKYDIETADKVIKSWRINDLKYIDTKDKVEVAAFCEAMTAPYNKEQTMTQESTAQQIPPAAGAEAPKPAETQVPDDVQKVIDAKNEEINDLKAQLESEQAEKRKTEYSQFAEQLVKDGNIAPSEKSTVIDLMEVCGKSGTYDFAEGDEKSVLNRFKGLLKTCKHVDFAEIATNNSVDGNPKSTIDFSDGAAIATAIETKRAEYQKQGIEKSEVQILNELKKGQE